MGFSDRILGKKNVNGGPHIESVSPALALAGGEIRIAGSGLRPQQCQRPRVQFGEVEGGVVVSSDSFLVARVPEGATSGPVVVAADGQISNAQTCQGRGSHRRKPASRDQSSARCSRQHLRDVLGFARPESSGRDFQDRYELHGETVRRGNDERDRDRLRPRRDRCMFLRATTAQFIACRRTEP